MPQMTIEEVEAFLDREFPQSRAFGSKLVALGDDSARVVVDATDAHLRPGGTVSGPALFTLVDHTFYCLVLATLGPVALAVTTHTSIDFLRRPAPGTLVADATLLKLGKRLAVGTVVVRSEGSPDPIAHATLTYSLPPRD